MFDLGAAEILVIIIVAVLVIGSSDMPLAMRHAGRWIGKVRRVSSHFRTGLDAMVREAELEDMEKKWKAQNEAIMKQSAEAVEAEKGEPVMTGPPPVSETPKAANAESAVQKAMPAEQAPAPAKTSEPETPAKPQD